MHSYTESTTATVQQFPKQDVKQWARSMIANGQARELLHMIELIPHFKELVESNMMIDFVFLQEREKNEMMEVAMQKAEKLQSAKYLHHRNELLTSLQQNEKLLVKQSCSLLPFRLADVDIDEFSSVLMGHQKDFFNSFASYLKDTGANKQHLHALEFLRNAMISLLQKYDHYGRYVVTLREMPGFSQISKQRPKSVNQRKNRGLAFDYGQMQNKTEERESVCPWMQEKRNDSSIAS